MKRGANRRMGIGAAIALLAVAGVLGYPARGLTQGNTSGIPSADETDGRFLGIAGSGLRTVAATTVTSIYIGVPAGQTSVTVEVFDGDLGGQWDNLDPEQSSVPVTNYTLVADPLRDGAGRTVIMARTNRDFADNAWGQVFSGAVDARAQAPSGNYFYRLDIGWADPDGASAEFNGFKVRANGQTGLAAGSWAFAGAPINVGVDPARGTAANRYDGTWDWYPYVSGSAGVAVRECDADLRTDPANPGDPPDDQVTDPRIQIPPDVRYSLSAPDGTLLLFNTTPSGNHVCQTQTVTNQGTGPYHWRWFGTDSHNLIFVELGYLVFGVPTTPLSVATAPTATPTPTFTATNTPAPASPTATPGGPTATPTPGPDGGGSGEAGSLPTPTATPTAAPTLIPTIGPYRTPVSRRTAVPAATSRSGTMDGPAGDASSDQSGADGTDPDGAFPTSGKGKRASGQAPAQLPALLPLAPIEAAPASPDWADPSE